MASLKVPSIQLQVNSSSVLITEHSANPAEIRPPSGNSSRTSHSRQAVQQSGIIPQINVDSGKTSRANNNNENQLLSPSFHSDNTNRNLGQRRGSYFQSDERRKTTHTRWTALKTVAKFISPGSSRRSSNNMNSNGLLMAPRKSRGGGSFDNFMHRANRRRSSGRVNIRAREYNSSLASRDELDSGSQVDKEKCRKKFRMWMHIVTALFKMDMRCKERMWGTSTYYRPQIDHIDLHATRDAEDITHYSEFDPSEYKANKQMRMSTKAKEILCKPPEERTDEEITYAAIALRGLPVIAEYPVRMQKKLAQYGYFECFKEKRPIVKQHHPPWAFYFILFGSVLVAVRQDDVQDAKTVVTLKRGQTFGELSIMNNTPRQSTVITYEYSEFLSIDVRTYENLFMVGGSKNINDPDHNAFIEKLYFLKHWPKEKLQNDTENVKFLYFNRGAVLTKDSNLNQWIFIIKSGSVQVLKKLVKTLPTVNTSTGKITQVPSKLDIHLAFLNNAKEFERLLAIKNKRTKWVNFPRLRDSTSSKKNTTPRLIDIDEEIHQNNVGSVNIRRSQSAAAPRGLHFLAAKSSPESARKKSVGQNSIKPSKHVTISSARNAVKQVPFSFEDNKEEEEEQLALNATDDFEQSGRRTYIDDLDSGYNISSRKITEADRNPMFVHVQTLTKGDVFGLNPEIFSDQPSLCLISNGCECILIKKKLYFDNCPNDFKAKLKNEISPYPDDGILQQDLLTRLNWDAYKKVTLSDLLHRQTVAHNLKVWV